MRKSDKEVTPEVHKEVKKRQTQSLSGLALTIGGIMLAIIRPELVVYGVGAALIGAGFVDFKTLAQMVVK